MSKTISRQPARPSDSINLTEAHTRVLEIIEGQDEVFLEFIKDKTGFDIPKANAIMAEIAILTGKYIPEIAWVCPKCREPSKIPLLEGLRISTFGSTTVKCVCCEHIASVKPFDTIISWKFQR